MQKRALLIARLVHILHRIALEAIDTEYQQQDTSKSEDRTCSGRYSQSPSQTHTETRKERIDNIAQSGTDTRNETIPAPLVQSALDT